MTIKCTSEFYIKKMKMFVLLLVEDTRKPEDVVDTNIAYIEFDKPWVYKPYFSKNSNRE